MHQGPARRREHSAGRRLPLTWRRVLVLGVLAVLAALALSAFRMLGAQGEALAARQALADAQRQLRAGDLDGATGSVGTARRHASDVQDRMQGVGGDAWSLIPVLGEPVRDVRRLGNALDGLTRVAEIGLEAWPQVNGAQSTLFEGGNVDLPTLERLIEDVRAASGEIEDAAAELEDIEGDFPLVGTRLGAARDEALAQVAPLRDGTARLEPFLDVLPRVLGAEGERKYLVAILNPAELRYSGGAPLTLAPLTFDHGRLSVGETIDTGAAGQFFRPLFWRKVEGNPFHRGRLRITAANFAPSWPVSGEEMLNAWRALRGRNGAGLIAVDVQALGRLLDLTGPLQVPGYPTLTSRNFAEELVGSYDAYPENEERKDFNRRLVPLFRDRLFDTGHLVEKLRVLADAADERRFAVYFRDDEAQEAMSEVRLTGDLSPTVHDYVGVFTQNTVASKSDYWQRRAVRSEVRLARDGTARVRLTVEIHNDSPPYMQPEPDPRSGYFTRWNSSSIGVFLPKGATVRAASVNGTPLTLHQGDYFGRPFVRRTLTLAPQKRGTFVVEYGVPSAAVVGDDGSLTYRVDLDPQPLVIPQATSVSVAWPEGYQVSQLPEGWKQPREGVTRWVDDGLVRRTSLSLTADRG